MKGLHIQEKGIYIFFKTKNCYFELTSIHLNRYPVSKTNKYITHFILVQCTKIHINKKVTTITKFPDNVRKTKIPKITIVIN